MWDILPTSPFGRKGSICVSMMILITKVGICVGSNAAQIGMWPLSDTTKGYEVIADQKSADLSGHVFEEGPVPGTTAVVLTADGTVSLSVSHLDFQSFSVQIYLYVTGIDGDLLNFEDEQGFKVFRMWLDSNVVKVEVYRATDEIIGYITSQQKLQKTNGWVNLVFGRDFEKGKLMLYVPGQSVLENDQETFPSKEALPNDGTFRIGGPTRLGPIDGIVSKACCMVVFNNVLHKGQLTDAGYSCTKNMGIVWRYKGPYPCDASPCQHGGSCSPLGASPAYTCVCLDGFTGYDCETDIHDCELNPCLHGQPCSHKVNDLSCHCEPDFTGLRCETEIAKTYDDGHYRLESQGAGPDFSKSLSSYPARSRLGCGQICVSVTGCRAFTLEPRSPGLMTCTLYTDVFKPRASSTHLAYYIPKYYSGPLK